MKIPHTYLFTPLIQFQVLSIMAHSRSWSWRKRQIIPGAPQSLTMAQHTHGPSRVQWPKCHILLKLVLWNAHWDIYTLKRRRWALPIQDQIISQGVSRKLCSPSSEERRCWDEDESEKHYSEKTPYFRNKKPSKDQEKNNSWKGSHTHFCLRNAQVTLISALETLGESTFGQFWGALCLEVEIMENKLASSDILHSFLPLFSPGPLFPASCQTAFLASPFPLFRKHGAQKPSPPAAG